mmetsp:Transcript_58592/g.188330  ORF Transcript_58592/g.188330 Transcript_58592/m.188330 type:complete len:365 (+) Transcript_58592:231-1325(+)
MTSSMSSGPLYTQPAMRSDKAPLPGCGVSASSCNRAPRSPRLHWRTAAEWMPRSSICRVLHRSPLRASQMTAWHLLWTRSRYSHWTSGTAQRRRHFCRAISLKTSTSPVAVATSGEEGSAGAGRQASGSAAAGVGLTPASVSRPTHRAPQALPPLASPVGTRSSSGHRAVSCTTRRKGRIATASCPTKACAAPSAGFAQSSSGTAAMTSFAVPWAGGVPQDSSPATAPVRPPAAAADSNALTKAPAPRSSFNHTDGITASIGSSSMGSISGNASPDATVAGPVPSVATPWITSTTADAPGDPSPCNTRTIAATEWHEERPRGLNTPIHGPRGSQVLGEPPATARTAHRPLSSWTKTRDPTQRSP